MGVLPVRPSELQAPDAPGGHGQRSGLVVGVYPSALHVAWTPPAVLDPRPEDRRARPLIGSLAVDVEPVVFWDGTAPSPGAELDRWRADVGFDESRHGTASVGHNGPSGAGVVADVLTPLGLDAARVAFTDVVPWYFVKSGKGSQGEAIASRFAPFAAHAGVDPGMLPPRPSAMQLVGIAASERRRSSLRTEVVAAGAPVVITLGQEALGALRAVAEEVSGVQETLAPDGYAVLGEVAIDGHRYDLLPLVHPGFRRQTVDQRWRESLEAWGVAAPTMLA